MTGWRAGRVVLVVAGVLAALPTTAVGAAAVDAAGPPPPGLSAGSAGSDAMSPDGRLDGVDFDGLVRFTWVDRSGVHTARLPVQGAGGVVRVGGPGGARGVEWPADVGPLPSLSGKYTTSEASGPTIAGRPTTVMQIWSGAGSSETLALDRATGLVLARAELDSGGSTVRSMEFEALTLRLTHPPGVPAGPSARSTSKVAPTRLPSEYSAPSRLAEGYQRLWTESVSGGLRVVYSDGVHGLSIFEQPGHLAGAKSSYQWVGGEVVTWQGGPTVFTAIGDGPSADVTAAARSVPQPHQRSLLGRLGSWSREVVDTLSGSR
ncbi:MAG: hypothetical protein E6G01_15975 [Actinobacteria bacterium]|nr:MAG: hypothetical protein E6G01_15975 [Actinomycetota bacterium]